MKPKDQNERYSNLKNKIVIFKNQTKLKPNTIPSKLQYLKLMSSFNGSY